MSPAFVISRYVLREGKRAHLPILALLLAAITAAGAVFVGGLAPIDGERARLVTAAAFLRPLGSILLILHIAAMTVAEMREQRLAMLLACGVGRAPLLLGKALGIVAWAAFFAVGAGLTLGLLGARANLLPWSLGLFAQLTLLGLFTLAASLALRRVTPAALAALAFYFLAESLTALQLMAAAASARSQWNSLADQAVSAVSWALPRFAEFGSGDWLGETASHWGDVGRALGQGLIYAVLLYAVALVDLYRRED